MGDLSKNFSRWEHACSCGCGFDTVDVDLNRALQELHDDLSHSWGLAIRIQITGGNRCFERNYSGTIGGISPETEPLSLLYNLPSYYGDGGSSGGRAYVATDGTFT